MKHLLHSLLCACLLAAPACSSKKDDPAASAPAAVPPGPVAKASIVINGVTTTVSMAVVDYGPATNAGGTTTERAIIEVFLPSPAGATAGVKYYLTTTAPLGAVSARESRPYNSYTYDFALPTGALTGREVITAGVKHFYLSGTFTAANLGPSYTATSGSFTDLQAY